MELINETLYNRVTMDALVHISNDTVKRRRNTRSRLFCLLIGLTGLGLGYIFDLGSDLLVRLGQAYGILFLLISIFWTTFQCIPNFAYNRRPELRRIRFHEAGFGSDEEGTEQFPYGDLQDVVESKDWIALFWDDAHGLILNRAGFQEGNGEELIRHLEENTDLHIIKIFAKNAAKH